MSSIDSLLNHEPTAAHRHSSQSDPHSTNTNTNTTTTFDAADALTTLATLGSGQQYAPAPPTRELPSPTASASHAPRRTSSFGSSSQHAPIEPEPPIDLPQQHSPTLEHYHHGSRSPEEQKRRQSLLASRSSPAPVLAPIQNLSAALQSHTTQHREPTSARDESTSSQTRTSEISALSLHPISTNLPLTQEQLPSPQPFIKNEPTGTPRESTPAATSIAHQTTERQPSASIENFDADTLKALEIAKQSDLGLRAKRNASVTDSIPSPVEPKPAPATAAPAPSKKRPAPSSTAAVKKKGTATVSKKPAPKKRKLDTDRDSKARSVTPTSRSSKPSKTIRKGSQAGTPVAGSSPAPDNSSQVQPSDDDAESSEDDALYCICKKPDNHKWMIGCDGGCDDWFHGDCVDMKQSDEDLVDKFICPLCEKAGRGTTTWKPMCRREGCRKPARITKGKESKYCSDECGVLFMTEQLQRTAGAKGSSKRKPKKKGMPKQGEEGGDHASDDEDEPTPLGGVLRAKDLKALVDSSPNIQAFRNLGSGVLSPPQTASPTQASFNGMPRPNEDLSLTAAETERLNALHNEKTQLKDRLEVLKDREKFVSMAKEQATRVAEREKIKGKEFCGYDSRLSWSDAEFLLWRNSKHGRASFQYGTLAPTEEQVSSMPCVNGEDRTTTPPTTGDLEKESVCLKKRCQKHPQWQKLNLQDARFEELEIVEAIKECEKEERSVRERARRRCAKDEMAKELTAGERGPGAVKERNREGWVEVVGS